MDDDVLFAELYPDLRRFAAAVASLDVDPDDLVQEAVSRTLRRHSLTELEDAATYLRRAMYNLARNNRRDGWRRRAVRNRLGSEQPHIDAYPSDFIDISALPVDQRTVLFLRYVEQRATADIAQMLGVSEEVVRSRSSRAIKALRIALSEAELP